MGVGRFPQHRHARSDGRKGRAITLDDYDHVHTCVQKHSVLVQITLRHGAPNCRHTAASRQPAKMCTGSERCLSTIAHLIVILTFRPIIRWTQIWLYGSRRKNQLRYYADCEQKNTGDREVGQCTLLQSEFRRYARFLFNLPLHNHAACTQTEFQSSPLVLLQGNLLIRCIARLDRFVGILCTWQYCLSVCLSVCLSLSLSLSQRPPLCSCLPQIHVDSKVM